MPAEGHVPTGIADVNHRAHDLEIGAHQVDDDAEGARMVDQRIEIWRPLDCLDDVEGVLLAGLGVGLAVSGNHLVGSG